MSSKKVDEVKLWYDYCTNINTNIKTQTLKHTIMKNTFNLDLIKIEKGLHTLPHNGKDYIFEVLDFNIKEIENSYSLLISTKIKYNNEEVEFLKPYCKGCLLLGLIPETDISLIIREEMYEYFAKRILA
jgi:hypothetical protein